MRPRPPWHVVHVLGSLRVGGAERSVVNYLQAADRRRFRHSVLCLTEAGALAALVRELGIPVHVRRVRWRTGARDVLSLAAWLRRERAAVVHSHLYYGSLWGRAAGLVARVPALVTTEHGKELWKNRAQLWLGRQLSRRTCRHIVVSEDGLRLRIEREGLDPDRLTRIANGVVVTGTPDPERRRRVRDALGLDDRQPVVGTVGRTVAAKGYPDLLAALARLRPGHPDLRWLLIGDGPERPALLAAAAKAGLDDVVIAAGQRTDIPDLLAAMDVFVMPSLREGLPVALLEAMATGRACLVTDTGGMPEAVDHGQAGVVVPAGDPAALGTALESLLADPERRDRLGRAALARARALYASEAVARRIEAIYLECLAGGRT